MGKSRIGFLFFRVLYFQLDNFKFVPIWIVILAVLLLVCIVFANTFLRPIIFGEKIIWVPETKELIVKSSKYRVLSSSVISFSTEKKLERKAKVELFQFELVDKEQSLSVPIFTKIKFKNSEIKKLIDTGNKLSRLLNISSFTKSEFKEYKEKSNYYLNRLRSGQELIKQPLNLFISHKMSSSLAFPENLSHYIKFSETPTKVFLKFAGVLKKFRLRTFILIALAIISMVLVFIIIL